MDPRARAADQTEVFRAALDGRQASMWTAMPAAIVSFDAVKMTAVLQVAIKMVYTAQNGKITLVAIPQLLDCPVQFPAGGGYAMTYPLHAGNEVLVVFASRCIDAWWQSGMGADGLGQPQAEFRMHDFSDGFCIPGVFSQPHVLPNMLTTGIEFRSTDRTRRITLHDDGSIEHINPNGAMSLGADGNTRIQGNLFITGGVAAGGEITAKAGTAQSIAMTTHEHPTAAVGAPSPPTPGT